MNHTTDRQIKPSVCLALTFAVAALLSGCLSSTYIIPHGELERLQRLDPATRAKRLHAIQRFITNADPPPAPQLKLDVPPPPPGGPGGPPGALGYPGYYPSYGGPTFSPFRPVIWIGGGSSRSPSAVSTVAPIVGPDGGVVAQSSSGLAKALSGTRVDDAKAAAAIAVVAAVGLGVGLAVTEGLRFDGYVAVHPQHPVHLLGPNGSYRLTSLDRLEAANPQRYEEAVIVRHEGIGMWELGRAPLARRGLTYSMEFGSRSVPIGDGNLIGATTTDFAVGAFVSDHFGLLLGVSLGFGDDGGADIFSFAPRFEAQWHPIGIGFLHLGLFGAIALEDVGVEQLVGGQAEVRTLSSPVTEGGAMLQFELTTRLAMNFRWGVSRWLLDHSGDLPQRFTIGLSVY